VLGFGTRVPNRRDHPEWCAGGHHCTAGRRSDGEHASVPEPFRTDVGKIVATRYQRANGTRDRMELRIVVELDQADEESVQQRARVAIAAVYEALARRCATRG
jgi:hypothetical protein